MNENNEKVIVRFPPSPTGKMHVGNIRTFLFNYLFAKKQNGEIVMRFEDTDRERSEKEHEESILYVLKKLGLDFSQGPFWQSKRTDNYMKAIETLISKDLAYEAEESEDGSGEKVIRFKNPNKEVTYNDIIRGEITIDTTDFGDFVIARSKTNPLYHLTVAVDDMDMDITHVIRGEDHITSTPRQILIIKGLGGKIPIYAHIPFIIGDDKKKLGKRHGATSYEEFEKMGYLPEAIINYLALLGWNIGGGSEQEFFTMEDLIQSFSLERVNNSPAMFSYQKLNDLNKQHIAKMSDEDFKEKVLEFLSEDFKNKDSEMLGKILPIIKERIEKFEDVSEMEREGELDLYFSQPEYETEKLNWKDETDLQKTKAHLVKLAEFLGEIEDFSAEKVKETVWDYAGEQGRGFVLWPMRYALSGRDKSPDPFVLCDTLGKEESLKRLNYAISKIESKN